MRSYRQYINALNNLTEALQEMSRYEKEGKPLPPRTPKEQRKARQRAKAVERAVDKYIRRDEVQEKKVRNLSVGRY